jgi:hypothetical protein
MLKNGKLDDAQIRAILGTPPERDAPANVA